MNLSIYVDESSQECHPFMVISALIVEQQLVPSATKLFADARESNGLHREQGELKWSKVSKRKLDAYLAVVDQFFELNRRDEMHWHCLIVESAKLNHHKFNQGKSEIGFSKFIYQLLVSIARKYEASDRCNMNYYVTLDSRTTNQDPNELRDIVNSGLKKRWGISYEPVKRIAYADSKKTPMIQVNELILGATAFHRNSRHLERANDHPKVLLATRICEHCQCDRLGVSTYQTERRMSVWNFQL